MAYFVWDEDLDVGVEAMNDQHKHLIDLMEVVYEKNTAGAPREDILAAVDELGNFVIEHFRDEEAMMAEQNFPGLEAHQQLHANLLKDFTSHTEAFRNSDQNVLPEDFMAFLSLWINTHIMAIDTKYSPG